MDSIEILSISIGYRYRSVVLASRRDVLHIQLFPLVGSIRCPHETVRDETDISCSCVHGTGAVEAHGRWMGKAPASVLCTRPDTEEGGTDRQREGVRGRMTV